MPKEYCIEKNGQFIKDLRIFTNWSNKDIVIIGNSMTHFMLQLDNGMLIKSFIGSENDSDLKEICTILVKIAKEADVRPVLKKLFGYSDMYNIFLDNTNNDMVEIP